jgi:hypothetical protein
VDAHIVFAQRFGPGIESSWILGGAPLCFVNAFLIASHSLNPFLEYLLIKAIKASVSTSYFRYKLESSANISSQLMIFHCVIQFADSLKLVGYPRYSLQIYKSPFLCAQRRQNSLSP